MKKLEFFLPGLPDLQSNRYAHWRTRHTHDKSWKEKVQWMARANGANLLQSAHVVFTRQSTREPDADNLAASFKPLLDGLKGSVIVDDSPEHISVEYRWEKAPRAAGGVLITIIEGKR